MKAFLLFTVTGPLLVLSKYDSVKQPELLRKLAAFGKFVAHEVPVESVKRSYSAHFQHVLDDPKQTDELRVLDENGERIFKNVSFRELGTPACHEPGQSQASAKSAR